MVHLKQQKPTGAAMAKRGIWFFMRTILLLLLLGALCYGAFKTASSAANLYILTTEGMQLRAECILLEGPRQRLRDYFTPTFIAEDEALKGAIYDGYTIIGFDYNVKIEGISVWPWSETAAVTLVERLTSLTGTLHEEKRPADSQEGAVFPPPAWEAGRYLLRFKRLGGRWYIYQLQLLEAAPPEAPKATPDLSMTPQPISTPVPQN
ncbi:MAG TPA: hypothetical protein PKX46_00750 [Clostridia bacterium]|nr:hypothetical protein [Clostridia bacterium]